MSNITFSEEAFAAIGRRPLLEELRLESCQFDGRWLVYLRSANRFGRLNLKNIAYRYEGGYRYEEGGPLVLDPVEEANYTFYGTSLDPFKYDSKRLENRPWEQGVTEEAELVRLRKTLQEHFDQWLHMQLPRVQVSREFYSPE